MGYCGLPVIDGDAPVTVGGNCGAFCQLAVRVSSVVVGHMIGIYFQKLSRFSITSNLVAYIYSVLNIYKNKN